VESFRERRQMDDRKAQLCLDHEVTLICWRYDEPITRSALRRKLRERGL
jgi:hypothetical protein